MSAPSRAPRLAEGVPSIELADPLAEALGWLRPGERFRYTFEDAVKLSGHACPTVAGAFLMTIAALGALYPGEVPVRGQIEATVGGTPDDGSAGPISQVIGLVTGAAPATGFGGLMGRWRRKNLLHFDPSLAGRVRFRRADTRAAVEVSYDPSPVPPAPEMSLYLAAVVSGHATQHERARFGELWQARVAEILSSGRERVVRVAPA